MEAVRAFNNELSSLYEGRPPVSRAKMASVTKSAIKAIKFYKHVVQSVEKFISKCKPEYKVPGLYVIDSIVRQSRHQFGQEKDMFSPRFSRNIVLTFQCLFKCPPDEKSKIIRVLNLWQKNLVFPSDIIQVLLNLAENPTDPDLIMEAEACVERLYGPSKTKGNKVVSEQKTKQKPIPKAQNDLMHTVNQLLQQMKEPQTIGQQQQHIQQLQLLQQQLLQQTQIMQDSQQEAAIDSNLLAQIKVLTNQLLSKPQGEEQDDTVPTTKPEPVPDLQPQQPSFNRKILDFDYGESDDEDNSHEKITPHIQPVQPPSRTDSFTKHPRDIPESMQETMPLFNDNHADIFRQQNHSHRPDNTSTVAPPPFEHPQPLMSLNLPPQPPHDVNAQRQPPPPYGNEEFMHQENIPPEPIEQPYHRGNERSHRDDGGREKHRNHDMGGSGRGSPERDDDRRKRDKSHKSRERRSRSRSNKRRRRSRSRSRDRRRRSRSRDKHRRSREHDDRERQRERERRKKSLALLRDRHLSVCSTTIWLGHIPKTTTEHEVATELEPFGAIHAIHMVPPRGCAFVCMVERKDALRALDKLKGTRINGSTIKIAWAPGKGVKESAFNDQWNVEEGVTYIPWDRLPQDITPLLEGGIIDEESVPDNLKGKIPLRKPQSDPNQGKGQPEVPQDVHPEMPDLPQTLPLPPPPILPSSSAPTQPFMAMPGLMQARPPFPPLPTQHLPGGPMASMSMHPGMLPMMAPQMLHPQMMFPVAAGQRLISPQMSVVTSVPPTALPLMSVPPAHSLHAQQMGLMQQQFDMQRLPLLPGMQALQPTAVRLPGLAVPETHVIVPSMEIVPDTNSEGTPVAAEDNDTSMTESEPKNETVSVGETHNRPLIEQKLNNEYMISEVKTSEDGDSVTKQTDSMKQDSPLARQPSHSPGMLRAMGAENFLSRGPFNPDMRMPPPRGPFMFRGPPGAFPRFGPGPPGFNPRFRPDGFRFRNEMPNDFNAPPRQFFHGPRPDGMRFGGPRPLMGFNPRHMRNDFPPFGPNDRRPPNEVGHEFEDENGFDPDRDNFNPGFEDDFDENPMSAIDGRFNHHPRDERDFYRRDDDDYHRGRNNYRDDRRDRGMKKSRWSNLNDKSDTRTNTAVPSGINVSEVHEEEGDEAMDNRFSLSGLLHRLNSNSTTHPATLGGDEDPQSVSSNNPREPSTIQNSNMPDQTLQPSVANPNMSIQPNTDRSKDKSTPDNLPEPLQSDNVIAENSIADFTTTATDS